VKKELSETTKSRLRFQRESAKRVNDETLRYPVEMTAEIGLNVNEINRLKDKGCPFYGKKTSVRIVRAFLYRTMGAESLFAPPGRRPRSTANKSDARAATSDSRVA
jgi:hypothetical protein